MTNKILERVQRIKWYILEWVDTRVLTFKKLAGIGGGLPYSKCIITSKMVSQELPMSCGPACVRQLLKDAGLDISEEMIRTLSKFKPQFGTQASDLANALNKLLKQEDLYQGGSVEPEAFDALVKRGSWIARVKLSTGPHFIIVDGIKDDKVLIREPWNSHVPKSGNGLACEIDREVFKEYWRRGIHQVVFK